MLVYFPRREAESNVFCFIGRSRIMYSAFRLVIVCMIRVDWAIRDEPKLCYASVVDRTSGITRLNPMLIVDMARWRLPSERRSELEAVVNGRRLNTLGHAGYLLSYPGEAEEKAGTRRVKLMKLRIGRMNLVQKSTDEELV